MVISNDVELNFVMFGFVALSILLLHTKPDGRTCSQTPVPIQMARNKYSRRRSDVPIYVRQERNPSLHTDAQILLYKCNYFLTLRSPDTKIKPTLQYRYKNDKKV